MIRAVIAGIVVVTLGFMIFLFTGLGNDPTKLEAQIIGNRLPAFSADQLKAPGEVKTIITDSDFKGPALINVWATWCPTCKAEHEALNELSNRGVKIYGIDYQDDPVKADKWLRDLGNPYLLTIEDRKGRIGFDFGVYAAPETYFIDADGIVTYRHTGEVSLENWESTLKAYYGKSWAEVQAIGAEK